MSNGQSPDSKNQYGFWIIIMGFLVVVLVFIISAHKWSEVKDVTAAVGAVTGTVGSLAGAFFGLHAGAAGKEKVEAQRDAAETKVERLASLMDPATAARAMNIP